MNTNMIKQQAAQTPATTKRGMLEELKKILDAPSVKKQFIDALGSRAQPFMANLIEVCSGDNGLQACKAADVVREALKAAVLDIPIIKPLGLGYIVVYYVSKKTDDGKYIKVPTPTFILGYRGLIQLALRTGEYRNINAGEVYEGQLVDEDMLSGTIKLDARAKVSEKVGGYFAHFELRNGFTKTLYMNVEDMASYAKRFSPSIPRTTTKEQLIALANANAEETGKAIGWMGNFGAMAIKTVMKRLIGKYGILSIQMQSALAIDDVRDRDTTKEIGCECEVETYTTVDAEAAIYEEVDTETGEIKSINAANEAAPY